MILLVDTSTSTCFVRLVVNEQSYDYEWEASRTLADGLLGYLANILEKHQATLKDVTHIGVMKGPGSFTGLRIGLVVLNTLADANGAAIVGVEKQDDWQKIAIERLRSGVNDRIVLPEYGREANITQSKK
jgi:tRNA threonylcarbamoyladenosine biosynthesis protein TsaB